MNRRENGLSADAYAPLIDLVPELADELLTVLREAGIAAYALDGDEDVPDPLDRVHVDVSRKGEAERLLHASVLKDRMAAPDPAEAPQSEPARPDLAKPAVRHDLSDRDEDAIFAEIVAGFGATPTDVSWPDEEERARPEPDDLQDRTGRIQSARVVFSGEPKEDEGTDFPEPDEDGHYVPPPPPPLPTGDPTTRMAWIALVGGPCYILATVLFRWEAPGWAAFLAVAAFIGGFVTLVLRMGDEPRDGDDGAII